MKLTQKWKKPTPQIKADIRNKLNMALDMTALTLVNNIVKSVNTGYPPASAPWTPPHKRTGHLSRSIASMQAPGKELARWIGTNIGNAENCGYAIWLEYGTRPRGKDNKGGMLPRPFLRPAMFAGRYLLEENIRKVCG